MASFAQVSGHGAVLDTSVLDRITAELKPKARRIVNTYGIAIAGEAAARAPVDTAALKNTLLSESGMTGDLTYTVQDGVEYGVYQEFGTSVMYAQPFLVPAIEAWRERFLNAFGELFK
jgi:HK97 gp10 family phage protein